MALIYAGTNGFLDVLPVVSVSPFVSALAEYLMVKDTKFFNLVKESKKLDQASEDLLKAAIAKVTQEIQAS